MDFPQDAVRPSGSASISSPARPAAGRGARRDADDAGHATLDNLSGSASRLNRINKLTHRLWGTQAIKKSRGGRGNRVSHPEPDRHQIPRAPRECGAMGAPCRRVAPSPRGSRHRRLAACPRAPSRPGQAAAARARHCACSIPARPSSRSGRWPHSGCMTMPFTGPG